MGPLRGPTTVGGKKVEKADEKGGKGKGRRVKKGTWMHGQSTTIVVLLRKQSFLTRDAFTLF